MKLSGFGNIKVNIKPLETNEPGKSIKKVNTFRFNEGNKINGFDGKIGGKINDRSVEMYGRKYEKVSILDRKGLYLFVNYKGNVLAVNRDGKKEIVLEVVDRHQNIDYQKVIQVTLASEDEIKEDSSFSLKNSIDHKYMIFSDTYEPLKIVCSDGSSYYVNEIQRDKIEFGSSNFLRIEISDILNKTHKKILVNGDTMEPLLIEGEFVIDIKPLQGYDKGNYEFTLDSVDPDSKDRYNNNKKYIIDIADELESIKLDEKKENAIFNMEGIPGFNKIENLIKKMDSEDTTDVEKNKLVNEFYSDIALFMKDDELKVLNISDTGKFPCKFKNGLELIVINQPINNMNDFSIKRLDGKNILNVKNVNYNGKIVELNITISEDLKNMINLQWDSEFFEDYKVNIKNILLIEYNDLIETSITIDNVYTDNQGKEVIIDKSNYQSFFDILSK